MLPFIHVKNSVNEHTILILPVLAEMYLRFIKEVHLAVKVWLITFQLLSGFNHVQNFLTLVCHYAHLQLCWQNVHIKLHLYFEP